MQGGEEVKVLYIRWGILIVVFSAIAFLGVSRYNRDVRAISPKILLSQATGMETRVMGMVDAGSLKRGAEDGAFQFSLSADGTRVPVVFSGDDADVLRELKTIVVVGRWDAELGQFNAAKIALIPNYGFIASAYLLSLLPLVFFLFYMERRVLLLYVMIKEEKVYQPEVA